MGEIKRRHALCLMGVFCLPLPAVSAHRTDSIHNLGVVVVKAKTYKEVIPAQTLKGEELRKLNSFSVADAIRYFSGLQIKDYGGVAGLKTVNIRSMGTNHTGVYYNGIQLGNAQNGQVDLGKFSLDNIEEISLYNGQKSDIFQSAREFGSSGSIYLTTRRPRFEGEKDANLAAKVKFGSYGLLNPALLYEHKISDNISAAVSAEWITSQGDYKFRYRRVDVSGALKYDTTAVRHNSDIDALRIDAGLYGLFEKGKWNVFAYHYTSERGIPGAIVNNVWKRSERLWDRNSFLQGSLEWHVWRGLSMKFNTKYASDYTHYMNNNTDIKLTDNIYKQRECYFSWANKYAITADWDVSVAYDFQWNGYEGFDLNKDHDKEHPMNTATRGTHYISAATAFTVADRLKVQASVLETFVNEEKRQRDKAPNKSKVTPGLFLSYQPWRKHDIVVRAFYKTAYRMPTFNDLYYTDMGNPALLPETTTQYNVGAVYDRTRTEGIFRNLHLNADVYYNDVRNKIVSWPQGPQFRWTTINLGRVDIRGVDAGAACTLAFPHEWTLTGKLQYTYQEAIDVTNPSDTYYRDQIPYIPWHSGSAIIALSWGTWSLGYSFIYVGERYNQQENIIYNHTQPWYTSDMTLMKEIRWGKARLRFTAEVNNLLDQDYDVILNYPMPMRNYKFGLAVEL